MNLKKYIKNGNGFFACQKKKKRKSFGQTFVFPFLFFPLSNNIVVFLFIII
jgi:hypothetical protein